MGGIYEPGVNPEAFASMHLGREHGMFVGGGCVGGVRRSDVGVGCGRYRVMLPSVCLATVVGVFYVLVVGGALFGWLLFVVVVCLSGCLWGFVVVYWVGLGAVDASVLVR